MTHKIRIAIDVMGGDKGPDVTIQGAQIALTRNPLLTFTLIGDQSLISRSLNNWPSLRDASEILHTDIAISMDEKPSRAVRRGRYRSSMWLAIDAVKRSIADVAVSAGNTGALTAMARIHLKAIPGIDRPAIAALWPTVNGNCIVLDLGAALGADSARLVQLALMGGAMARAVLSIERPTIGLLNIGTEEVKGNDSIRDAGRKLQEASFRELEYIGFIEGNQIGFGAATVVVTEGFAGNIALKVAEGTAMQMVTYLRGALRNNIRGRLGALIAKPAFEYWRDVMDANKRNGGIVLGLNGLVVKSHGNATAEGFACAIDIGSRASKHKLLASISELFDH